MFAERRRGWQAALLAASVLLNLFLGGVVAGRLFASLDPIRRAEARAPTFLARFRALPAEERAKFDEAYQPHRQPVAAAREALRAARLSAFGALGAPLSDRAVMQQDFDAVTRATDAAQTAVHAALLDAFATLTPESRAILAGAARPEGP